LSAKSGFPIETDENREKRKKTAKTIKNDALCGGSGFPIETFGNDEVGETFGNDEVEETFGNDGVGETIIGGGGCIYGLWAGLSAHMIIIPLHLQ
jgi:hypothetical protein